ncbi:MAG: primosomal protein N' [Spirochaetes bacterium GWD1_27_9]|nr:MAG: primosomal protein N' [Spirochaetes bacterium GWB1_27_13]OHD27166.1 MAG: primosomal protein N' [Spirochaetes bacterium GWC1_27_15]OHD30440.1 MAG: primosomal protein N' [Spirochaetes bacterium GWD1_27_9]
MEKKQVLLVAIPINLSSFYSYLVPEGMNIEDIIGRRVLVNFKNRKIRGFAIKEGVFTDKYQIKPILKVLDKQKIFKPQMVDFAKWIASYYFAGIGEVLSLMVPKGIKANFQEEKEKFIPKINKLSTEQEEVYNNIIEDIKNGKNKFYIYGITGSGKTEIYIKLIEDAINQGKSVIFLVPEIVLSYQTLLRLKQRFGKLCAVLHSTLKTSERLKQYLRLYNGDAKIAIGPRSALFAPLDNIGLIIIDEENEGAFKSDESPRFHTRTASIFLANYHKATLVLGSATPSVESFYYAKKDFFKLYTLKNRYGGATLPDIQIINAETLGFDKNLTLEMSSEINKRLQKKEQIVLLQNRRGFSTLIKCGECKNIINCPRCNISLTYHKSKEKLICHHCGYTLNFPEKCPTCESTKLIKIGAGTQRIEDEVAAMFSYAKIQRMDYDSLKTEKDLQDIFHKIEKGEIDILVGTQMIAKGLHFPNIKFVGIVNSDLLLNIPDFKSAERTYALITQVAGRAGREGAKGFVMIQTTNPDHYSITCAKEADYEKFFAEEIEFRKILNMPPFVRLLRLVVRGKDEEIANNDIYKLFEIIKKMKLENVRLLGPAPCLLQKLNNNFRFQLLLKSPKIELMQEIVTLALKEFKCNRKNYLEIDVDPSDLF